MVPRLPASFAVRPRCSRAVLVPALLLAVVTGCGHRRSSMRPVYVTPALPAACAPGTPGCSTGSTTPTLSAPIGGESTSSVPLLDRATAPASVTPPRSTLPEEPSLDLAPAEPAPKATIGPKAEAPKGPTSMNTEKRSPSGRLRTISARERLATLVNDPEDLFAPPKADRPWKYVVLHHSAKGSGNYNEIDREHRDRHGWDGCGYHFVIGNGNGSPDGQIEVARRWGEQKQGIHCRNSKNAEFSEYGIGICLIGNLDETSPTPKQIASTRALVSYLSAHYQIPAERIATHEHVAATITTCPGKHFSLPAILGSNSSLAQR